MFSFMGDLDIKIEVVVFENHNHVFRSPGLNDRSLAYSKLEGSFAVIQNPTIYE